MFPKLQFQGTWRSYQQRILNELETHLEDEKLHVVAAPGAGKTILGLEVLCRVGRPCLILAPTITIKHQWGERLKQSFMTDKKKADEIISTNILAPKMMTLSTYQGLLAGLSGKTERGEESGEEETTEQKPVEERLSRLNFEKADHLIQVLKAAKIEVLCLDEAHHLRREWWKALDYVVDNLKPKKIISLTATPPYDVDHHEWERYEALCGPVDAEISIPELVKQGDLCPHQDLIYFAHLRQEEEQALTQFEQAAQNFVNEFLADRALAETVAKQSFWADAEQETERLFEDPDFYLNLATLLKTHQIPLDSHFLSVFSATGESVPELSLARLEELLNGLLSHQSEYPELATLIEKWYKRAAAANLVQYKKIMIRKNEGVEKMLARSLGKLDAIESIVKKEVQELGQALRMVILADLIHLDSVQSEAESLGVVPIFKRLQKLQLKETPIAILTGQIILVPTSAQAKLKTKIAEQGLSSAEVSLTPFKYQKDYVLVQPKGKAKSKIVDLITELFNQGSLKIMIGTQALLGEGWDAPCINSLILSSTVASYMLSNQMRGRAIRIDKNQPDKVSHIWHLANLKVLNIADNFKGEEGDMGGDFETLKRRFAGYEAPCLLPPYEITNGMARCLWGIKPEKLKEKKLDDLNNKALTYTREETKSAWKKGLRAESKEEIGAVRGELYTNARLKSLPFLDVYFTQLAAFGFIAFQACKIAYDMTLPVWVYACIVGIFLALIIGPTWRVLKTGRPEKILEKIASVLLDSLYEAEIIDTPSKKAELQVQTIPGVHYTVTANGLNQKENHIFMTALQEFLAPIQNPRYLLMRQNTRIKWWQQSDYHAVPTILSDNKTKTDILKNHWKKEIGFCEIFYTRTIEGRRFMLQAKGKAYSGLQNTFADKLSRWQAKLSE